MPRLEPTSAPPGRIRVRAAALIAAADRILLVRHRAVAGYEYWVPPGGGMEPQDESLAECARREVFEETGLEVNLARVAYVREYRETERSTHHVEVFFAAEAWTGEPSLAHLPPAEPGADEVLAAGWVPRDALNALNVYPRLLRDLFWDDLAAGFTATRYLGRTE